MPFDQTRTITPTDWARFLGCPTSLLPAECVETAAAHDFRYRVLAGQDRENVFLRVFKALHSQLEVSGPHRLRRWEDGWSENLREFERSGFDPGTLVPKFIKNDVKRLQGEYILPESTSFEIDFVSVLWQFLFRTYFSQAESIYEFGCGPGQNLVELARIHPDKRLYGLDWAQSALEIVENLRGRLGINVQAERFDFFCPSDALRLEEGAAVFTAGALEQTGVRFQRFLDWLLEQSFSICVNVETLQETYDPAKLFDYVACSYIEKRGYLQGYLSALRRLEEQGAVRILKVHRVFGSLYNDVYTYVAWEKAQ